MNSATRIRSNHTHGTPGIPFISRRFRLPAARPLITVQGGIRNETTPLWAVHPPRHPRLHTPKQEASISDLYIPTPHDCQYRPEGLINVRRDAEERCNPHPFNSPAWHVWNAGYQAAVSHVVGKIAHHRSAGE